jgi:hypothetical protein
MGQLDSSADKRLAALSAKGDPLEAIDRLVPWESFRADTAIVVLGAMPVVAEDTSAPRLPLGQDDSPDSDVPAQFKELQARRTEPLNLHRVYNNAPKLARVDWRSPKRCATTRGCRGLIGNSSSCVC